MPTYEYVCSACQHEFEEFQAMSAKPLRKCPECGKNALERKIGLGAAVLFKGGGFYETDYRSDSYKKGAESEKKPESNGHVHTGSCACGSKPASECASGAAKPAAEPKPKKKPSSKP